MSKSSARALSGATRHFRSSPDRIVGMLDARLQWYYHPGERLPTEGELSEYFEVSRPTIRKALLRLERAGRLRSRQGSGWYAVEDGPSYTGNTIVIICEDLPEHAPWLLPTREMRQLAGIRRTFSEAGYELCIRLMDDRVREAAGDWAKVRWSDYLNPRTVGGVMAFWRFGHRRLRLLDVLREYAPLVATGASSGPGRGEASLDVAAGVFKSFSHLMDRGHRRIAFVSGGPGTPINQQRYIAKQLVGRILPGGGVLRGPQIEPQKVSREEGARIADVVLADTEAPTAAHVAARELGEGFYARLRERGIRVPEDFSLVVEADDGKAVQGMLDGPTRVEFEYEKLGDRAAELLLKIIAEPRKTHSVEPLPTDLVVGSTTGDVRETHRAPGAVPKQSR